MLIADIPAHTLPHVDCWYPPLTVFHIVSADPPASLSHKVSADFPVTHFHTVSGDSPCPRSPPIVRVILRAHALPYSATSTFVTSFKIIHVACGIVQSAINEFVVFQIRALG